MNFTDEAGPQKVRASTRHSRTGGLLFGATYGLAAAGGLRTGTGLLATSRFTTGGVRTGTDLLATSGFITGGLTAAGGLRTGTGLLAASSLTAAGGLIGTSSLTASSAPAKQCKQ
jgi:hypothetical protein